MGEVIDYEAVLADLEAKRANLESVISGIKALMALGVVSTAGLPARGQENAAAIDLGQIQAGAFFGMSIPDATRRLLDGLRKPLSLQAISDALLRGGFATTSKDFANTVGAALRRQCDDGEIVRVGNTADWGLREWYPGLRRKPRGKSTEAPGPDSDPDLSGAA
jgi:hypothetical protein